MSFVIRLQGNPDLAEIANALRFSCSFTPSNKLRKPKTSQETADTCQNEEFDHREASSFQITAPISMKIQSVETVLSKQFSIPIRHK